MGMIVPLVLLLAMAFIGSIDGAYYHTYKFALYRQPSARLETVTHVIRAFALAFTVLVLTSGIPVGRWFWVVAAVFAVDFIDDIVDVAIEPRSRAPLGGLPPLEYLIHMIVMALSGGVWVSFLVAGWASRDQPTALVPHALPWIIVWTARGVAVGAILMGASDAIRLVRAALISPVTSSR
jgi:hypothetical protein